MESGPGGFGNRYITSPNFQLDLLCVLLYTSNYELTDFNIIWVLKDSFNYRYEGH
ncbi:hypothetical protein NARC_50168 [Candidatus Nitrosocosmicus arcticus]|uniref:Uncharacterized protein n=1 Tax=Candidatus Nitrosocosmicus arcticus TaxID=2035267 RepID=A0A557SWJ8_9ARCH|nr:hypothetical protein NARC_50168 [Candidatus Nitrosocosmicus arcticus]